MPEGGDGKSHWVTSCVEVVVQNARKLGLTGTRVAILGFLALCLGSIHFGVEPKWALAFFVVACVMDPVIEFMRVRMQLADERSRYREVRASTKRRIEGVQQENENEPELPLSSDTASTRRKG